MRPISTYNKGSNLNDCIVCKAVDNITTQRSIYRGSGGELNTKIKQIIPCWLSQFKELPSYLKNIV